MTKPSDLWPDEFYDLEKILQMGAKKYGPRDWELEKTKIGHTANHNSMFHHLAESYAGQIADKESKEHPLLHLACRALMGYTLWKRKQETNR